MDRVEPDADPSAHSLRCEDWGAVHADAEPGWERVTHRQLTRREPGDSLYYCPIHAAQFELRHPDVVPA